MLAEHLARHGPGPAGLVFTNTRGNPLTRSLGGEMWHHAASKAGIRNKPPSTISPLLCLPPDRQRVLGQGGPEAPQASSAMETLDTYGHLWPDSDDETREAVDSSSASSPTLAEPDLCARSTVLRQEPVVTPDPVRN